MKVHSVSKRSHRLWAVWVYLVGIWAALAAAYDPAWPRGLVIAVLTGVAYGLVGWFVLRYIVRPRSEWSIGLTNSRSHQIRVAVSPVNGGYSILRNGELVRQGQSLKVMLDMEERIEFLLHDEPAHRAVLTLRTPRFFRMRLYLEVDGEQLAEA